VAILLRQGARPTSRFRLLITKPIRHQRTKFQQSRAMRGWV